VKVKYGWYLEYPNPSYWKNRTPLYIGMPKFFLLYQDLDDKKLRVFFKKLRGKVLDAGCGDGRFIEYADVGVDFSRGMLTRAKKRHPHKTTFIPQFYNYLLRTKFSHQHLLWMFYCIFRLIKENRQ
jgi:SAM-dependent methyltransferase